MKAVDLTEKLQAKAVFGIQDIERIAYCDKKYAKVVLSRLKAGKLVKKIRRNAYTLQDNVFVVASNITYPSYISFLSASCFLGYTEQIANTVQLATTRKIRGLEFENYKIRFVPLEHFFGYKKIAAENGEVFIVEDEKLLIDCLLKPKECGNMDEIEKVFEKAKIAEDKLISYLKQIKNQTLVKRAGFLLEKSRGIDISKSFKLDKNYPPLNPFERRHAGISKKWRLKV